MLFPHTVLRVKETSFFFFFLCTFMVPLLWVFWKLLCVSDTSTATAMIGFRERERTRERRLSWARVAIFFLWVILVFSLISLFFSINNESKTRTSHSIPPKRRSFSRALFQRSTTTTSTTQKTKLVVSSKNGDADHDPHTTTLYGDEKRIIHTGPNPLHN